MTLLFYSAAYLALFIGFCTATLQSDLATAGIQAYFPGSSQYNTARLAFNRRFDVHPAAITFPTSPAQVASTITIGKNQGLRVVARSGGHSYIANGLGGTDGALVVDLSKLKSITVNTSTNQATIQTGNRLGDVALALNTYNRALPHGTCPFVGFGGHAVHGGYGFTGRMWGLTVDSILSAEVVLADGTIKTASATQNTDLFWALRGVAPSFGIVTSLTVKVYTAPTSTFFNYGWDLSAANTAKAITNIQTFSQTSLPAQLGFQLQFWSSGKKGNVYVSLSGGWYGQSSQLSGVLKPFLDTMPAPGDKTVTTQSWVDHLNTLAGSDGPLNVTGRADTSDTFYAKSLTTPSNSPLSASSITAFSNYLANQGFSFGSSYWVQMDYWGNSAITSVGVDDTAYPWRQSLWNFQFYASSPSYQPPYPSSGITLLDGMVDTFITNNPTTWNYGAYANYADDQDTDWRHIYYGSHYDRLKTLKAAYDPTNLFSFATSVEL